MLGPRSIEYWERGSGFNAVLALKAQRRGYISPQGRNRGFVQFAHFFVKAGVIVVKNQGLRSRVEWIWRTEVDSLPLYFLVFTEYWNDGYFFHTIRHKEETEWIERASTVVEQQNRTILDFEVAPTIYYPVERGKESMWHLYAL